MKMVRDATGRFPKRPHYEPVELDHECEAIVSSFLRKKHGEVRYPLSTDDLTLLIEQEAEDLDQYADLSAFGSGVEGVTIFNPGSKPKVKVSTELASSSKRENRFRTTLAHEYGHVHFHSYLFDPLYAANDLFAPPGSGSTPDRTQVCKRDTMVDASYSDWMEWQAGHVCGAILMPASAVRSFVRESFAEALDANTVVVNGASGAAMIETVSTKFQASQDAARVRLLRLKIISETARTVRLI